MLLQRSDDAKFAQSLDGIDLSAIASTTTAVTAIQRQNGDTDFTHGNGQR